MLLEEKVVGVDTEANSDCSIRGVLRLEGSAASVCHVDDEEDVDDDEGSISLDLPKEHDPPVRLAKKRVRG